MLLERRAVLPFPADELFERARDDLHLLAELLVDVERIEPLTRRIDDTAVERVDRWRTRVLGSSRRALPTTRVTWVATSRWDHRRRRVTWTIDVVEPARAAASRGSLDLRALNPRETEAQLSLQMTFDNHRLARLMSFAWRPWIERYAGKLLDRNIRALLTWEPRRQRSA